MAGLAKRRADETSLAKAPAVTRSGQRILTFVNLQGLGDLSPEAAHGDGVGLGLSGIRFFDFGLLLFLYLFFAGWIGPDPSAFGQLER